METIISDKKYIATISLRQDELLAPIIYEMMNECPDTINHTNKSTLDILGNLREGQHHVEALASGDDSKIDLSEIKKNIEATQSSTVAVAMDMIMVNAWIYSKGYASKIMSILLVPEGEKFDESKIPALQELFGAQASREIANEVINYFFQRSGVFGIGMQAFSPKAATK
jgi:hypothetical protein